MKKVFLLFLGAVAFALSACAMPMVPPNPSNPYKTVAVLPMYNATNDVDGPQMVRELIEKRLEGRHYVVRPESEVNSLLRDQMGVTLGAQLEMTTPQKLGEVLGVDALLYGYLLNFDDITTGVYNVKKVRAGWRLVDARTGRLIWAGGQGVKNEMTSGGLLGKGTSALSDVKDAKEGLEPYKSIKGISEIPRITEWHKIAARQEGSIGDAALKSLGEKLVTKAIGMHLKPESETMINMVFNGFPVGPGSGHVYAPAPMPAPKVSYEPPGMVFFESLIKRRDFMLDMAMTTSSQKGREMVINGAIAKRGTQVRSEMDMSNALKEMQGGEGARLFSRTVHMSRAEDSYGVTIYPEAKKYIEVPRGRVVDYKATVVERKVLGEETVDGHPAVKSAVTYADESGKRTTWIVWEARDLNNFIVRALYEGEGGRSLIEFRNIRFVTPPERLFRIPEGFVKANNMMEIMMEGRQ